MPVVMDFWQHDWYPAPDEREDDRWDRGALGAAVQQGTGRARDISTLENIMDEPDTLISLESAAATGNIASVWGQLQHLVEEAGHIFRNRNGQR